MITFAEYCKEMGDQNLNEFLFRKVKCPMCGANLEVDNSIAVDLTGKNNKHYTCPHCKQDYSSNTKTGALEKVYNADVNV